MRQILFSLTISLILVGCGKEKANGPRNALVSNPEAGKSSVLTQRSVSLEKSLEIEIGAKAGKAEKLVLNTNIVESQTGDLTTNFFPTAVLISGKHVAQSASQPALSLSADLRSHELKSGDEVVGTFEERNGNFHLLTLNLRFKPLQKFLEINLDTIQKKIDLLTEKKALLELSIESTKKGIDQSRKELSEMFDNIQEQRANRTRLIKQVGASTAFVDEILERSMTTYENSSEMVKKMEQILAKNRTEIETVKKELAELTDYMKP